jgi:hypothetical protein
MSLISKRLTLGLAIGALMSSSALAQDATPNAAQDEAPAEPTQEEPAGALSLELNSLQPSDGGCRFTFVAENGLGSDLSRAAFELVLFDSEGTVERITVVDFQDLPESRTKVRQFDFKGTECDRLGRVLVNDTTDCTGDGVEPKTCLRQLETSTKASVQFGT